MKKMEEGSDKSERRKKKQDKVKKERRSVFKMFSHFHKNVSHTSKFTDSNSHACVVFMHSSFSKGYAVARLVEALRRQVASSIPDGVIGIFL